MKIKLAIYLLLFTSISLQAQIEDTTTTHIVKSGDTMHSITRDYLGTDFLWQDNWKLNPQVKNPHVLTIGQKLTVIKERIIPAEKATMLDIVNNVEKKLIAGDWLRAQAGDKLQQQEGVRTLEGSSTLLEFNASSSLKILEFSQVFLQSRKTSLRGTDSSTIEIIEGDTELKWEPLKVNDSEIEIISGQTKLIPENLNGKVTALRTGISKNGNSVVSVYEGQSNVESGGSIVSVPKGMGLSVKQGEKPPEPKPLLKYPKIGKEFDKQLTLNYTNPILNWQAVPQAKQYLVEVCLDLVCNQIFNQIKTVKTETQLLKINQSGHYYWRVAAISEDDIVGYKTKIMTLIITQDKADIVGPSIAINVIGQNKINSNNVIIAPTAKLKVLSIDEQSGLDKLYYRWNQEALIYANDVSPTLNLETGTLTIHAVDVLGNESIKAYNISYE